jgi:hypothetical protein
MATMCGAGGVAILTKTGDLPDVEKRRDVATMSNVWKSSRITDTLFPNLSFGRDCRLPSWREIGEDLIPGVVSSEW